MCAAPERKREAIIANIVVPLGQFLPHESLEEQGIPRILAGLNNRFRYEESNLNKAKMSHSVKILFSEGTRGGTV